MVAMLPAIPVARMGGPPGKKRASPDGTQAVMVAPVLKSSSTVNAPMSGGGPAGNVVVVVDVVEWKRDVDVEVDVVVVTRGSWLG